jgi:ADP-dependent NAD(P)H-hydrate dehydratase / NAD(P)H-hydrate epimerase
MQRVLTAEEMQWCDRTTIRKYGIAGSLLMERAGQGAAAIIKDRYSPLSPKRLLLLCGKGNNGGDGFVIARELALCCSEITVLLFANPSELKGDAAANFSSLIDLALHHSSRIKIKEYTNRVFASIPKPDLLVDAIFGTGFSGAVRKPASDVIAWMNAQNIPVVSIDIPSGVNGTTGTAEGKAVRAERTITFGALKTGLLCNAGKELSGMVHLVDIGIPPSVSHSKRLKTFLPEATDIFSALPVRSLHAHKYSVGKVFIIAGSKGLTGAAALSSLAAMRSGAGAVVLGTPDTVYSILARKLTEVMVQPLPATNEGTLALSAWQEVEKKMKWADVVVVGPGLSQHPETQQLVIKLLSMYRGNLLIDADGLNAVAARGIKGLRTSKATIILTPHVGEFSRLTKLNGNAIELQRIDSAKTFAKKIRQTVVLKGVPTVTAAASGEAFLNSTGNPGMATAGSGDVLSGIIAGLWAQGMTELQAAYAGVFLHGRSGDLAAQKLGERSVIASDLIKYLPAAFNS